MPNMSSADETTSNRLSNQLGFIDTSVARIVDGSCEMIETGLREAVNLAGERYRPYAEKIERQTSHHARKAANTTKEGTTTMLQKLDPMVDRAVATARTTTVSDMLTTVDRTVDRVASHPQVQQGYGYTKRKYTAVHDTTVASPTYAKLYNKAAGSVSSLTSHVKRSPLYAEHLAQYTEPIAQRVKSSSYYKAAMNHVIPVHTAAAVQGEDAADRMSMSPPVASPSA